MMPVNLMIAKAQHAAFKWLNAPKHIAQLLAKHIGTNNSHSCNVEDTRPDIVPSIEMSKRENLGLFGYLLVTTTADGDRQVRS